MYTTAMHVYLNMHIHELYYQQSSAAKDCLGRTTYYGTLCVIIVLDNMVGWLGRPFGLCRAAGRTGLCAVCRPLPG